MDNSRVPALSRSAPLPSLQVAPSSPTSKNELGDEADFGINKTPPNEKIYSRARSNSTTKIMDQVTTPPPNLVSVVSVSAEKTSKKLLNSFNEVTTSGIVRDHSRRLSREFRLSKDSAQSCRNTPVSSSILAEVERTIDRNAAAPTRIGYRTERVNSTGGISIPLGDSSSTLIKRSGSANANISTSGRKEVIQLPMQHSISQPTLEMPSAVPALQFPTSSPKAIRSFGQTFAVPDFSPRQAGPSSSSGTALSNAFLGCNVTIKDESKARINDHIVQEKLLEAKAMNRKNESGAVMHTFSLWNKAPRNDAPQTYEMGTSAAVAKDNDAQRQTAKDEVQVAPAKKGGNRHRTHRDVCAAREVRQISEGGNEDGDEVEGSERDDINLSNLSNVSSGSNSNGQSVAVAGCFPVGLVNGKNVVEDSTQTADENEYYDDEFHDDFVAEDDEQSKKDELVLSGGSALASNLRSMVSIAKLSNSESHGDLGDLIHASNAACEKSRVEKKVSVSRATQVLTSETVTTASLDEDHEHDDPYLDTKSACSIEEDEELILMTTLKTTSLHGMKATKSSVETPASLDQRNHNKNSKRDVHAGVSREHDAPSPTLSELSHNEDDDSVGNTPSFKRKTHVPSSSSYVCADDGTYSTGHQKPANRDSGMTLKEALQDARENGIANQVNPQAPNECECFYAGEGAASPIRWKRGPSIGEGTFGKVYKGLNEKTGELLAVKQLCITDGTDDDVRLLRKEISVMWELNHINIVRYLGTAQSERYLFIVLEYVPGGSIANMLKQFGPFTEKLIRRFSAQILAGVDYLHNKQIIHRDIKGANVLVTEGGIAKLADFGCSKQLAGMCTASLEESLRTIRGSVPWMAPEVITQSGHGRSSDVWSVGATVIEMATGKPPWPEFGNNLAALFHVATSKKPPEAPAHLSAECVAFINKCLVIDPKGRSTAAELVHGDQFLVSSPKGSVRSGDERQDAIAFSQPAPLELFHADTFESVRSAFETSMAESDSPLGASQLSIASSLAASPPKPKNG